VIRARRVIVLRQSPVEVQGEQACVYVTMWPLYNADMCCWVSWNGYW